MKALKRALTAFVCLSLLYFTGMGASADKSPAHTGLPSGEDCEQIRIQQVYAVFNDQIARQAEDIYGGAYITEDNELVLCLTEGTGLDAFEKASLNIREKFRETVANSTKTKAIQHSSDAKLRIKAVKYSLKQLQSTQAALTGQMEELGIQALWSDPETNCIYVEFTAGTADGQAAGETAKAQTARLASKKQALCAALPPYAAADMFLFKEADPDGQTVTTAKI